VQEYNEPHKPVRMFTYLIGREISDLEAAKWMACNNKGYFTHVTTLAEVKEQVGERWLLLKWGTRTIVRFHPGAILFELSNF
jgi:hypothetical protein